MAKYSLIFTIIPGLLAHPSPALARCPGGMVPSSATCVDRFEASLWKVTDDSCSTRRVLSTRPPGATP